MFTQRRLSINQRDNHCQIAALSLSHPANCIATTATAAAAAADVGSGIPRDHSPVPFQWRNEERGTKGGGVQLQAQQARECKTSSQKYFMTDDHNTEFDKE